MGEDVIGEDVWSSAGKREAWVSGVERTFPSDTLCSDPSRWSLFVLQLRISQYLSLTGGGSRSIAKPRSLEAESKGGNGIERDREE